MESLEKEVNDITSLLADGELLPAIDKSLLLAKNRNESLYENLVQLRSRYKYFEKNRRDGIISYQDQTIEIASLNRYLIEHLSDLRKISQGSNQLDWVPNTIETFTN